VKLMGQIWEDGEVVGEWKDAVTVLNPKKGDLKCCDH